MLVAHGLGSVKGIFLKVHRCSSQSDVAGDEIPRRWCPRAKLLTIPFYNSVNYGITMATMVEISYLLVYIMTDPWC